MSAGLIACSSQVASHCAARPDVTDYESDNGSRCCHFPDCCRRRHAALSRCAKGRSRRCAGPRGQRCYVLAARARPSIDNARCAHAPWPCPQSPPAPGRSLPLVSARQRESSADQPARATVRAAGSARTQCRRPRAPPLARPRSVGESRSQRARRSGGRPCRPSPVAVAVCARRSGPPSRSSTACVGLTIAPQC